jgi:hypothetical protein
MLKQHNPASGEPGSSTHAPRRHDVFAQPLDALADLVRGAIEGWFDFDTYREHMVAEASERAELLGLPAGDGAA